MFCQDMVSYVRRDFEEFQKNISYTFNECIGFYNVSSGRFSRLEQLKMPVAEKTVIVAALFSLPVWLLVGNISAAITFGVTAIYVGTATLNRLLNNEHYSDVLSKYEDLNRPDVEPPAQNEADGIKDYNMKQETVKKQKIEVAAFDVNKFVEKAKAHLLCVMAC